MTQSISQRLRRIQRDLESGKVPIIKKHLPHVEELVEAYGLVPHVDVFIPPADWHELSPLERGKIRAKFCARRRYKRTQEELHQSIHTEAERLRRLADLRLRGIL